MTNPGQDNPPPQRPAEPTRAVQLPRVPPPPPGAPHQTPPPPPQQAPQQQTPQQQTPPPPPPSGWAPPPPPGAPQQSPPPPPSGWGSPAPQDQHAQGQHGPGQHGPGQYAQGPQGPGEHGPQGGWTPPGQPPQGQQPQGQPYQQWAPGQGGPDQQWGAPAPAPTGGKGGKGKLIGIIAGAVLLVAVGVLLFLFLGSGRLEVGDCVTLSAEGEAEEVDCGSSEALFEVIGVQDGEQTYEEYLADPNTCADFPETVQPIWQGAEGEEGTVLCAGAL
ncbi:LppU/SCO3897 family protein [Geodermatophilus sp. SYSU D00815]